MYFIYGGVYTSTLISQYPSPHHLSFKEMSDWDPLFWAVSFI